MEHYFRVAQDIINAASERNVPVARDFCGGDPVDIESELVYRFHAAASELGQTMAELLTWLENREVRPMGAVTDRRGRERRGPHLTR